MSKHLIIFILSAVFTSLGNPAKTQQWEAFIHRDDGQQIPFTLITHPTEWIVVNGKDSVWLRDIHFEGDSLVAKFPIYESLLTVKISGKKINGYWYKKGAAETSRMPISAKPHFRQRNTNYNRNLSGKYKAIFEGDITHSIGLFERKENKIFGTFQQVYGDLGYLQGLAYKDSFYLSSFDGVHALLIKGKIAKNGSKLNGTFYSRNAPSKKWTAKKDANVELDYSLVEMRLKAGADSTVYFKNAFKDSSGSLIDLNDPQFENKVVVLQNLGTWCPNCIDETKFLVEFYNRYKSKGFVVIGLAYEYTTDEKRSMQNLKNLQQRLKVTYPLLWTGVAVGDKNSIDKTLPQFSQIGTYPTSIILDKNKKLARIDTDFNGPATGAAHQRYTQQFEAYINTLLSK